MGSLIRIFYTCYSKFLAEKHKFSEKHKFLFTAVGNGKISQHMFMFYSLRW